MCGVGSGRKDIVAIHWPEITHDTHGVAQRFGSVVWAWYGRAPSDLLSVGPPSGFCLTGATEPIHNHAGPRAWRYASPIQPQPHAARDLSRGRERGKCWSKAATRPYRTRRRCWMAGRGRGFLDPPENVHPAHRRPRRTDRAPKCQLGAKLGKFATIKPCGGTP